MPTPAPPPRETIATFTTTPAPQPSPTVFFHGIRNVRVLTVPLQGWPWWLTTHAGAPCWLWNSWTFAQKYQFMLRYYYPAYWWSGASFPSAAPAQVDEITAQIRSIDASCSGRFAPPSVYSLGGPWGVAL